MISQPCQSQVFPREHSLVASIRLNKKCYCQRAAQSPNELFVSFREVHIAQVKAISGGNNAYLITRDSRGQPFFGCLRYGYPWHD